jgi:hypothetical protein
MFAPIALNLSRQRMLAIHPFHRIVMLTALISALALPVAVTLRTRTVIMTWGLDLRIVGIELSQFAIDLIRTIGRDSRPHIEVRKTIAAAIIGSFRSFSSVASGRAIFNHRLPN